VIGVFVAKDKLRAAICVLQERCHCLADKLEELIPKIGLQKKNSQNELYLDSGDKHVPVDLGRVIRDQYADHYESKQAGERDKVARVLGVNG
jgi:hypothetical protein